jgi:hypothetical protein
LGALFDSSRASVFNFSGEYFMAKFDVGMAVVVVRNDGKPNFEASIVAVEDKGGRSLFTLKTVDGLYKKTYNDGKPMLMGVAEAPLGWNLAPQ